MITGSNNFTDILKQPRNLWGFQLQIPTVVFPPMYAAASQIKRGRCLLRLVGLLAFSSSSYYRKITALTRKLRTEAKKDEFLLV